MDPVSFEQNVELLPLSQSDKWLISAHILNMVTLTTTDTGLAFFKFRKRALTYDEYLTYLEDLAISRNINLEDMKVKMQTCGRPKKTS
ncbi:TPPP family protein [Habropoda laboriosa]|uniref:TPPP family protein n=2 Tax=Habropoda laboriosa TaxID=597456 RepID=A0A0L7R0S0_9HYME|nr:TPPP family protein [Habropoda laboriosa]